MQKVGGLSLSLALALLGCNGCISFVRAPRLTETKRPEALLEGVAGRVVGQGIGDRLQARLPMPHFEPHYVNEGYQFFPSVPPTLGAIGGALGQELMPGPPITGVHLSVPKVADVAGFAGGLGAGLAVNDHVMHKVRNAKSVNEHISANMLFFAVPVAVVGGSKLSYKAAKALTEPRTKASPAAALSTPTAKTVPTPVSEKDLCLRAAESDYKAGRLRAAWGNYRQAATLGGMTPGIQLKLDEIEGRLMEEKTKRP